MKWLFAKNEGGRDTGFHDAGVETFKGNFDRYLAREMIQNSLDARLDPNKPVNVTFELLSLDAAQIPDLVGLKATFRRCAEYYPKQKKARQFFERAEQIAGKAKIPVLRIGDYNTTGVIGSDTDREKNWYNLIRSSGSSSKAGDEGGSFGLGKNAPFAASQMRTVLYSTYNVEGEYIFQGVAMLVSHSLPGGPTAQPTGYLGGPRGESFRAKSDIPPNFLRTKRGTDIFVLGFPEASAWQQNLMHSVLGNFWPAIDWGDLEVTVGTETISRSNLATLMQRLSAMGGEEFDAHHYYNAYKSPAYDFPRSLQRLAEVTLYLSTGDPEFPKRVAMIRKTGMVIFHKQFRSVIPFCGAFICRNETGNKLLRDMEPPRHDVWDSDHPEKNANKAVESEYVHFIRDCVKQLLPSDDSKILTVPGLSRFLPDDDETPEETFDSADEAKSEGVERAPLPEKIEGRRIDPRRAALQPDRSAEEGEEATDEIGGKSPDKGNETGTGGGDDDGVAQGGADGKGGGHGERPKPAIPIRYRTFATNVAAGVYSVTLQSKDKRPKNANVAITAVGDDQRIPADIKSARFRDGQMISVRRGGILGPLSLPNSKGTVHIEIVLREPMRVAMEVAAHEAD